MDILETISQRLIPPCECVTEALDIIDIYPDPARIGRAGEHLHPMKASCPACGNIRIVLEEPPEGWIP